MITAEEACLLSEEARKFDNTEFTEVLKQISNEIQSAAKTGKKHIIFELKHMYCSKLDANLNKRHPFGPDPGAIFMVDTDPFRLIEAAQQHEEDIPPHERVAVKISWARV